MNQIHSTAQPKRRS